MSVTELSELLRAVKVTAPDARWDTLGDGTVVILTYLPLEV